VSAASEFNTAAQDAAPWAENLTWLFYRMSSYWMLNVADDAALLALVFC